MFKQKRESSTHLHIYVECRLSSMKPSTCRRTENIYAYAYVKRIPLKLKDLSFLVKFTTIQVTYEKESKKSKATQRRQPETEIKEVRSEPTVKAQFPRSQSFSSAHLLRFLGAETKSALHRDRDINWSGLYCRLVAKYIHIRLTCCVSMCNSVDCKAKNSHTCVCIFLVVNA